jgi:hypothetical protein
MDCRKVSTRRRATTAASWPYSKISAIGVVSLSVRKKQSPPCLFFRVASSKIRGLVVISFHPTIIHSSKPRNTRNDRSCSRPSSTGSTNTFLGSQLDRQVGVSRTATGTGCVGYLSLYFIKILDDTIAMKGVLALMTPYDAVGWLILLQANDAVVGDGGMVVAWNSQ